MVLNVSVEGKEELKLYVKNKGTGVNITSSSALKAHDAVGGGDQEAPARIPALLPVS